MRRNFSRAFVFTLSVTLVAIANGPVMAQSRGGGTKGGAKTGGGAKVGSGANVAKSAAIARSAGPQFNAGNPTFSAGIANNAFSNAAFRNNNAFNTNPYPNGPTIATKGKGPVNRSVNLGNGYGGNANAFYGARIPRGGGIYIGGIGGIDLGYPLRNGFDPYVLQGFSSWSPLVFSTAAPPYAAVGYAPPPINNNFSARPNALGSAPNIGNQIGNQVEAAPAPRTFTATLAVIVPNDAAELWFNGVKTQTSGPRREFVTPELTPGQSYTYEVRVRWTQDGKIYEQTRSVSVQSGGQSVLNFMDLREQLPPPIGIKI